MKKLFLLSLLMLVAVNMPAFGMFNNAARAASYLAKGAGVLGAFSVLGYVGAAKIDHRNIRKSRNEIAASVDSLSTVQLKKEHAKIAQQREQLAGEMDSSIKAWENFFKGRPCYFSMGRLAYLYVRNSSGTKELKEMGGTLKVLEQEIGDRAKRAQKNRS